METLMWSIQNNTIKGVCWLHSLLHTALKCKKYQWDLVHISCAVLPKLKILKTQSSSMENSLSHGWITSSVSSRGGRQTHMTRTVPLLLQLSLAPLWFMCCVIWKTFPCCRVCNTLFCFFLLGHCICWKVYKKQFPSETTDGWNLIQHDFPCSIPTVL